MPNHTSILKDKTILIAGAGLAGSLLACYFAPLGCRVLVLERRGDPRAKGFVGGRSINLALSARGIDGLEGVGLADRVLAGAIPMRKRVMHSTSGELTDQPYSANPEDAINSVSRSGLNLTLLEAADEHPGVEIRFNQRVLECDFDAPSVTTLDEASGQQSVERADLVIGADGAFSAIRMAMQVSGRFNFSQDYLEHGYKELMIPPAADCGVDPDLHDGFALEPNALHIWPRGGSMMIALPNLDKTFTCTLFWPYQGEHAFDAVSESKKDIRAFFERHYPDAVPLMPTLADDYLANPIGSLVTVRCWPWQRGGKVALVGDAAHAIVPFYGQGMNAAFEDCRVLHRCIVEQDGDIPAALDEYQRLRKPEAEAIADMALENFVEMRDKVGRPEFLYRKKIEQTLHKAFPGKVEPQYNLVSFSTVPYTRAQQRGRDLAGVIETIAEQLPANGNSDEPGWSEAVRRLGKDLLDA
ncbi:MAG: FAD-dependent monooxygenase [Phycisphaerales bacterium]|nr:FAD-dependent monooxygenase [Phycisphaerales bacterium]